ncbi:hypothetical protein R1CP_35750 (plasmid) [Rhodococcus opacus]|uniref:Uncharacterized protein n=1 Tax=Rhodococcus opacus TaxID=37919 RepID=A0A1B1KGM5_RHOOP|nr:hypothetical protein R1CP_35750 [Rhodococcus opacus]
MVDSSPALISSHRLSLVMDYGQFYLSGDSSPDRQDDLDELVEEALSDGTIASNQTSAVVVSPHQNNFDMQMAIEVWDQNPPEDRGDWDQVVDLILEIDQDGSLLLFPSRWRTTPRDGRSGPVPRGSMRPRLRGPRLARHDRTRGHVAHPLMACHLYNRGPPTEEALDRDRHHGK